MPYRGSQKNKDDKARWQREWRKKHQQQVRDSWAAWEAANPGRMTDKQAFHLQSEYNMSPDEYLALLGVQDGLCAACRKPPKPGERLVVDHDHKNDRVRGLCHRTCNSALGMLGDTADALQLAVDYLRRYERAL